ncbi:MAG: endolytic transglycosylase MltG [Acidobacteria bacterium]|nr:MAG: endolytic transglycosylase MltG [Acidobacteriota bacterium]REK01257.1 MAG: endolytic transglycosylase MltG [Acidobacteriota bacterium]REK14213.1 MAG: endolytic transglycosylase MltG [Acidobacteriota bacterium]REK44928.1 MAG: endolytic transglycosylase MltG [Acidobacteriota bacterium]
MVSEDHNPIEDGSSAKGESKRRRGKAGIVLTIVAAVLVLAAASVALWFYLALTSPVEHAHSAEFLTIEKGSSTSIIVDSLAAKGLVRSPLATKLYLRGSGRAAALKAGEYKFPSPINSLELIELLEAGNERTGKITIPEGWTRFEISERIAANFASEPPMDSKAVLYLMDDTSLIQDIAPEAKNLEGFLYPATYDFPLDAEPKEVIERLVNEFKNVWKPEWTSKAKDRGLTPLEVVTIASLIENESKVDSERKLVASVIYNRLDRGMALGIDATNVYIAKLLGRWDGTIHKSDIEVNHPYNTRKITGLPPGPISSASESAIEAALDPASTDYLYYVLDVDKNDGSHVFYASAAAFEQGKAKYQRWLAEQRRKQ